MLLLMAALCMKMLVPAGFMIASDSRTISVALCGDGLGPALGKTMTIPSGGGHSDDAGKSAKGECPFSGLSSGLAAPAPAWLAVALAFAITLGFAAIEMAVLCQAAWLRPPMRGPPLHS